MVDVDRMFRSELAILAEQPTESDLWSLDPRAASQLTSAFDPTSAAPFDTIHDDVSNPPDWDNVTPLGADHTNTFSPPPADPLQLPPLPHTSEQYPAHGDTALGLFPDPNCRLGGPVTPIQQADHLHIPFHLHHHQQTVHLSDVSLGITSLVSMPMPISPRPSVQIPMSASSSGTRLSDSPTDSHVLTDPSSEDMDSDDFELTYLSDSEFLPSPVGINPATLSVESMGPHATPSVRPSRRPSRAMTNIPVPIPNLTKKSRGRKVPTSNGDPVYTASKDKTKKGVRMYTCHADGCGKCFVRGEHLKRHIRSIHTDEKRGWDLGRFLPHVSLSLTYSPLLFEAWICTFENCSRAFSRQDNLNQHLRIHRLQDGDD
ncbi:hypothetical protein J3R82DRAFT_8344 [Butyriboletus roseoflavus]|nr:hypothetical protein J3R82DRAFT_8344 [Butyriboletus roseoflavus]